MGENLAKTLAKIKSQKLRKRITSNASEILYSYKVAEMIKMSVTG